jgi:hypothetical protein
MHIINFVTLRPVIRVSKFKPDYAILKNHVCNNGLAGILDSDCAVDYNEAGEPVVLGIFVRGTLNDYFMVVAHQSCTFTVQKHVSLVETEYGRV